MGSSSHFSPLTGILFLSWLLSTVSIAASSAFASESLCHRDEGSALLQFRESFIINACDPSDPFASEKLESWKQGDCCLWDGVECDNTTGHVIGLDLSSSCLYGTLSSNSSLFQLIHLRHLNLAYNNFSYSPIPSKLGYLSQLTYLNLSSSSFSGQIPPTIFQLSKLSTLNLYGNDGLILNSLNFVSFIQNFTNLENLNLGWLDISSTIPESMANLSSLQTVLLERCGLYGRFPEAIFQLPNLKYLTLSQNWDLKGQIPEFNSSCPLQHLILSHTSFSGVLPASIGELTSLIEFEIWNCSFYGQVPTSFGNLTHLSSLDLALNNFERHTFTTFSWLSKLTKLTLLGINEIRLNGEIPLYLTNLTQLETLDLSDCELVGSIPSWLPKLNQLDFLSLSMNQLQGPIPSSISQLTKLRTLSLSDNNLGGNLPNSFFQLLNLEELDLERNNLSGTIDLNDFLKLKRLTIFILSSNKFSLLQKENISLTRKLSYLGLGSCGLQQFPNFLHDQDELIWLDLSNNNIHGHIPKWIWNTTRDKLEVISFASNFLTGFESNPNMFPWPRAVIIDLQYNLFQGSLPMPPPSTLAYILGNNQFTGQIPQRYCELSSLLFLDLSSKKLGGEIPQCLGNFSTSLQALNLFGNNFRGKIPQTHSKECNLQVLQLDYNQLDGQVPKSLINCSRLEFLTLGDNKINDAFPSWLGLLPELKVLVLRSNYLYGTLETEGHDQTKIWFPNLRIIDIGWNNFSGPLPTTQYFLHWKAMQIAEGNSLTYLQLLDILGGSVKGAIVYYPALNLTNKGVATKYSEILEYFVAIDLSGNRFDGKIPECLGELRGLRLLNLSNNALSGHIPSSFGNLSVLEALDISQNKLSGVIPQQLTGLTFLSFFNASHNNLTGPIPHGNQFDTFQNDSYDGNSGLCGIPLSKKCGDTLVKPPSSEEGDDEDEGSPFEFGWKSVAEGYVCGLVVGIGIGHFVYKKKNRQIAEFFGVERKLRRVVMGIQQRF